MTFLASHQLPLSGNNLSLHIKFRDESLVIPKRGSKDIIFTSANLKLLPQGELHGGTLQAGRAYELKSETRELDNNNSGIVIHLWRE